jgi:hypothetical protein
MPVSMRRLKPPKDSDSLTRTLQRGRIRALVDCDLTNYRIRKTEDLLTE